MAPFFVFVVACLLSIQCRPFDTPDISMTWLSSWTIKSETNIT